MGAIFSLGHRNEKSRSTGCTPGRPAKKPVMPCAMDEPDGKISRANTSSGSWSRWRAPILSTTSRLLAAAGLRQGPYMLSAPSTSIEVSEKSERPRAVSRRRTRARIASPSALSFGRRLVAADGKRSENPITVMPGRAHFERRRRGAAACTG